MISPLIVLQAGMMFPGTILIRWLFTWENMPGKINFFAIQIIYICFAFAKKLKYHPEFPFFMGALCNFVMFFIFKLLFVKRMSFRTKYMFLFQRWNNSRSPLRPPQVFALQSCPPYRQVPLF